MITLSLDEFGEFEESSAATKPIFIAGVLYDDKGIDNDTVNERKRIEAYYRNVIDSVSTGHKAFSFPSALHSVGVGALDHNVVAPVKRKVNASLGEFLRKGTFDGHELVGQKRQGEYYIFVILKSDLGMVSLLNDKVNFMLRDDYASNLYFHMASQVVSRLLFHNPVIRNFDTVSMNIATRRSEDLEEYSERSIQYQMQGYLPEESITRKNDDSEKIFFKIASGDIYRSVLSQEMINAGKTELKIDAFEVKSINYRKNKDMEFLYLADSICSFLGYNLTSGNADEWITKIANKAYQINDKKNALIFGYDEIDVLYQKAWSKYEQGLLYESLSLIFASNQINGAFAEFYRSKWFKELTEYIIANDSEGAFIDSVHSLYREITSNELEQDKALFVLNALIKMSSRIEALMDDAESKAILYELYDAAVSLYCHIGDSKTALRYYNKCKKYVYRVGVERYLVTLNRMVETLLDCFEWKRAKQLANESIKYQQQLLDMKNSLPVYQLSDQDYSLGMSKALSQMAQVLAFSGEDECEKYFRKALESFPEDSADYKITQSYLLHYYMEKKDVQSYEEEATKYFGGQSSLDQRFKYILSEAFKETPVINYKYALYVFVKGVYIFEQNRLSDKLLNKLCDIDAVIKKSEVRERGKANSTFVKILGHPSEMICKYIALLAKNKGKVEEAENIIKGIDDRLLYVGPTISMIINYAKAEYYDLRDDKNLRNAEISEWIQTGNTNFEAFKKIELPCEAEERFLLMGQYMTYMYH